MTKKPEPAEQYAARIGEFDRLLQTFETMVRSPNNRFARSARASLLQFVWQNLSLASDEPTQPVAVNSFDEFTECSDHCLLASEQDVRHQAKALREIAIPAIRWAESSLSASQAVAQAYVDMIHSVEQRCMAADGPVTPTHKEITDAELRAVYVLALDALGNPSRG